MAAMNGHKAVARYLVENGADVNRKEEGDYGNALQAASYQGSENIVRFLVEKGAVSTFKEERLKVHSRRHHTTARRISSDCLSRKAPMSTFKEESTVMHSRQLQRTSPSTSTFPNHEKPQQSTKQRQRNAQKMSEGIGECPDRTANDMGTNPAQNHPGETGTYSP